MKGHCKYLTVLTLAVIMVMAMAVPVLAAEHGLSVWSHSNVSGGGLADFQFRTAYDTVVTGRVIDYGDSHIYWRGYLSDVKMNQGWDRVKAEVAVKVWGYYIPGQSYYLSEAEALDGVFSFDFTGTTPTELESGDYILHEDWYPNGQWTIKVPSIPIPGHELGCFGYNFHTGDPFFEAYVIKTLSR